MLKFNTGFLRLGLLHTIATNLCIWAKVVVHEATEAIVHMDDHMVHHINGSSIMSTTHAPLTPYTVHHDSGNHGNSLHGDSIHSNEHGETHLHSRTTRDTSRKFVY